LITGLIFLVILTLLSVAAMRTTLLEEKMAGNARDIDLAFQSAESALRQGQEELRGAVPPALAAGTPRTPRIANGALDAYWITPPPAGHNWTAQSAVGWQPNGTFAPPRYVIELVDVTGGSGGGGLGIGALPDQGIYRVTARGVGATANTVVILQTSYQR
jgi:type IV pilus assembly protein PilX